MYISQAGAIPSQNPQELGHLNSNYYFDYQKSLKSGGINHPSFSTFFVCSVSICLAG